LITTEFPPLVSLQLLNVQPVSLHEHPAESSDARGNPKPPAAVRPEPVEPVGWMIIIP
jgi:hypothetical protein